ncbi:MAG: Prepilin-type N-terminal cleavage/methylation protein [Microbacteriaceae bacterium]|nr:Prepilin-type N-terminal cleavage/methylation protein [Microbacteriaceae bacterium]
MTKEALRERDSERGFTLVELLIYSMLLILVLAIVGAMIASTTSTSKIVTSMSKASAAGQLTAESIERGIRNSSDFLLTSPSGTDQMLVARTVQGAATATWVCAAWYYSATKGTIRYTTSPTAIAAPTASGLAAWTLLDPAVSPVSGSAVFSATGVQLTIAFNSLAGAEPPVAISSTVLSRAGSSGTPACY